ncbi:hypothetical protein IHE44_0003489 [Lamprotornis superbus]|uniref:Uncharacterized protein n=1 Tax=Lamprotornis superbus TaxID=245042 RepID=A0A835TZ63_9PASS|nr:hypothetical protein IHE44_0003489 [Lamprotornis superbus]
MARKRAKAQLTKGLVRVVGLYFSSMVHSFIFIMNLAYAIKFKSKQALDESEGGLCRPVERNSVTGVCPQSLSDSLLPTLRSVAGESCWIAMLAKPGMDGSPGQAWHGRQSWPSLTVLSTSTASHQGSYIEQLPKQQQQNNFSLFPSTKGWNFRGKKRKKSTQDEDTISICSLDTSTSHIVQTEKVMEKIEIKHSFF